MVVGRDYMLKKPAGPSAPKLFLDTQVVPRAVNLAGGLEVALDRASARTGIRPMLILAGAAGAASLMLFQLLRRPADAGSRRNASPRPDEPRAGWTVVQ